MDAMVRLQFPMQNSFLKLIIAWHSLRSIEVIVQSQPRNVLTGFLTNTHYTNQNVLSVCGEAGKKSCILFVVQPQLNTQASQQICIIEARGKIRSHYTRMSNIICGRRPSSLVLQFSRYAHYPLTQYTQPPP